jgi:hypothetical protein
VKGCLFGKRKLLALEQRLTTMEVRKTELTKKKSLLEEELRTNNGRFRQSPVHMQYSVLTFLYLRIL